MADIVVTTLVVTPGALARVPFAINATETDAATNSVILAAPGAGKSIYLTQVVINCAVAQTVTIENGGTAMLGPYTFLAAGGTVVNLKFDLPVKLTANTALTVSAGGAYAVYVEGFVA